MKESVARTLPKTLNICSVTGVFIGDSIRAADRGEEALAFGARARTAAGHRNNSVATVLVGPTVDSTDRRVVLTRLFARTVAITEYFCTVDLRVALVLVRRTVHAAN